MFLTLPFFSHLKCEKGIGILLAVDIFLKFFTVRKDIDANSEDEVKVKEQAVLELGKLLAETRQAEGYYFYYMNCFQYFWYNNNVNNIYIEILTLQV